MSEQEFNKLFAKNLSYWLDFRNKTQLDLAKYMGVSTASVSNWCKGIKLPRMDKVDRICDYLHINHSDLMENKVHSSSETFAHPVTINVLGRVAAGVPIEAVTDIVDTEEITEELARTGEFFGLKIKGDSMEPRICDGDVVIVRQQEDADSGDTVIAMVNGNDAVCKRLLKYKDGISLISLNTKYEPMVFSKG